MEVINTHHSYKGQDYDIQHNKRSKVQGTKYTCNMPIKYNDYCIMYII